MFSWLLVFAIPISAWEKSAPPYVPCASPWEFVGPTGYVEKEGSNNTMFVATNTVAGGHDGIWFVGTVNGGVWRTKDLYENNYNPKWEPVTDNQPVNCAAIGAMTVATFDSTLVAAGCGGTTSSMMEKDWNVQNTGDWGGLMISQDQGDTWEMTNFPVNYYITGVMLLEPKGKIVVSARSHAADKNDGGIWISSDLGKTFKRTLKKPVYDLIYEPNSQQMFASLALDRDTVSVSFDNATTWTSMSDGLDWGDQIPFFTQLAINTAGPKPVLFLVAFTLGPKNEADTHSNLHSALLGGSSVHWKVVSGQPRNLDPDHMPKDRVTILADPEDSKLLYLAGNTDPIYRIDWTIGEWTLMIGRHDTIDDSEPHGDCRKFVWDSNKGNLLLVQDGGLSVRLNPRTTKGQWVGVAGNMGTMEFYTAGWDERLGRWIGGAQDNSVQITRPGNLIGLAVVGGDGTRVYVDNTHCPARLVGSSQMLGGLSVISEDPPLRERIHIGDMSDHDIPYFLHPITLNYQQPDQLYYWVNGSQSRPGALYQVTIPKPSKPLGKLHFYDSDHNEDDNDEDDNDEDDNDDNDDDNEEQNAAAPVHVVDIPNVLDLVVGGYTNNKSDPSLIVAMNDTHLYQRRNDEKLSRTTLPSKFAITTVFDVYDGDDAVVGPLAHGKTVSLAVSPANSANIAICGWARDMTNGEEKLWFTQDAAKSWIDITGNLVAATETTHRPHPSGILIVEYSDLGFDAILVGTVSGVYLSWTDNVGRWSRVGLFSDLPLVKVQGLNYEPYSDTLVAATFGRGIYVIHKAKLMLLKQKDQQTASKCDVPTPPPPASSAKFFPPQEKCFNLKAFILENTP